MLSDFRFESIISLGVDCRVRFQIARYFDALRAGPPAEQVEFAGTAISEILTGTNLFDWNLVWFGDVIKALEARFEGLFARDELRVQENNIGCPIDGRYSFRYTHLFKPEEGMSFSDMISKQYDNKAKIILFLRDKFLSNLQAENPTLYVRCQGHEHEAVRFCEVVKRTYPSHRFHLLLVDTQEETTGFTTLRDDYSIYQMAGRVRKPANAAWTGDDGEWTDLFEQVGSRVLST